MLLSNHKVVDILTPVFDEIYKWLQNDSETPESGGVIVGYQHRNTGNISIENISHPYFLDKKNRTSFAIKDPRHKIFIRKALKKKSYYMGVWHTHPQSDPVPSSIDWADWYSALQIDRTGGQYIFFIIAGTEKVRIWAGDFKSGIINELIEADKNDEGVYYEKNK